MKYLYVSSELDATQSNVEPTSEQLQDYDNGELLILKFENDDFLEPVIDTRTLEAEGDDGEDEEEMFITGWFKV